MNLFGSCMEKNSDRALLLFGDWRKSLFFSPAPLTPLRRLAPPVQGRWEWRLGGGGAEWGDCLGILLRRERARSLCSGSPQRLGVQAPRGPVLWRRRRAGDLRSLAVLPHPPRTLW